MAKIPHLHEIARGIEGRSMPERIADLFELLDQDGEQIGQRHFFAGEGTPQGIESFEVGCYGVMAIWFWLVETPPITTVKVSVPPGGSESGSRRLICMMPATKPGASPAKTTSKERESPAQTVAAAL